MATILEETAMETPSGKDVAYENFPVGSWLLPAAVRPHIAAFYAFARAADDIADNPKLNAEEKVRRLDAFKDALTGKIDDEVALAKAVAMRRSLAETGTTARHCLDLLAAFKQDAIKARYADWGELIGYCELSAAPVGRYLLDLHDGSSDGYGPSDALCIALQIINHLQDCGEDYTEIDRVYLPQDWLAAQGADISDLGGSATSPALRKVQEQALDGVDRLLDKAEALPRGLRSRRLAMESGAIIRIARRLSRLLRRNDPLARRVELSKSEFLLACCRGAVGSLV